jgi:hypothetical protein
VVTQKARCNCGSGRGLVVANHVAVRCRESLMWQRGALANAHAGCRPPSLLLRSMHGLGTWVNTTADQVHREVRTAPSSGSLNSSSMLQLRAAAKEWTFLRCLCRSTHAGDSLWCSPQRPHHTKNENKILQKMTYPGGKLDLALVCILIERSHFVRLWPEHPLSAAVSQ